MKPAITAAAAVEMIPEGATIHIGGFGSIGTPMKLINALVTRGVKNLTVVTCDTWKPNQGVGKLFTAKLVARVVTSYIGLNSESQQQLANGELEVELVPQGTLAERIRAAGVGLGGILTPTGMGTAVAEGKQIIDVQGKSYLLEEPIHCDFALISAHQADYIGNLQYAMTAQNFNPLMAMAAATVFAEPDHIVPVGVIPPDAVKTPGVLVDYLIRREAE